jgi:hypothetical protein
MSRCGDCSINTEHLTAVFNDGDVINLELLHSTPTKPKIAGFFPITQSSGLNTACGTVDQTKSVAKDVRQVTLPLLDFVT